MPNLYQGETAAAILWQKIQFWENHMKSSAKHKNGFKIIKILQNHFAQHMILKRCKSENNGLGGY